MDNSELTHLLQASGSGNANAFRKLSGALGPRMYALAARLLNGDAALAQDAVQEALIKLWQGAPNWQPTGSVAGYASRLVYTCCMDLHRSRKTGMGMAENLETIAAVVPEGMTLGIFQKQQRTSVLEAINSLPERQAEAVRLSYFNEFQAKEVAAAMGTSEGAVESLLVRARRTLAQSLPQSLMGTSQPEGALNQTYIPLNSNERSTA